MPAQFGVQGGSFNAGPPQGFMPVPQGGSFNAGLPQGFMAVPQGGSFNAAPPQGFYGGGIPQTFGGSANFSVMPMAGVPVPRMMGGSITMPVAAATGQQVGVCASAGCTKPGIYLCSQCSSVAYCSAECQQASWPTHKPECKKIAAEAKAAPVPTPSYVAPQVMAPQTMFAPQTMMAPQGTMMMPPQGMMASPYPGYSLANIPGVDWSSLGYSLPAMYSLPGM